MKALLKTRAGLAVFYCLASLCFSLFVGGAISISGRIEFLYAFKTTFLYFGAFMFAAAFLLIATKIDTDITFGFGAAAYYGTVAVAAAIYKFNLASSDRAALFLGAVIALLICYIVYLKHFNQED